MSVLNEKIVAEVAQRLKRREFNYRIKDYLKANGVTDEDSEIYLVAAKKQIRDEKIKQLPARNKAIFISALIISLTSFILFVLILPAQQYTSTGWLSLLGAVLFTTSAVATFLFFRSWQTKKEVQSDEDLRLSDGVDLLSIVAMISLIPVVIVYFIFSWNFGRVSDNILKENQVEVIGTIVDGSSFTSKSFDFTDVYVTFTTTDGKEMIVAKDISQYDFKNFYKGQLVPMIYSSKNPEVIELFNRDSKLREFKETEERHIRPEDLLHFINLTDEEITKQLKKIAYGWEYNSVQERWENQKRLSALYRAEDGINLLADNGAMLVFDKDFFRLGFKEEVTDSVRVVFAKQSRKFVSEKYVAIIESTKIAGDRNMPLYITTVKKR
ncbi:MAG: hypothetical protein WBG46_04310 [Nonlabens sp.]